MGSSLFKRRSTEKDPNKKTNPVVASLAGAVLVGVVAGGAGLVVGNNHGVKEGKEDCRDNFGPNALRPVGDAHPLTIDQVAAMRLLAKSDTKPVSFHTSSDDLKEVGLAPILDDLDQGQVISVSIPYEMTVTDDPKRVVADALVVGNILKRWAHSPDTIVKLTPEGTQQEVDPGTEVMVQLKEYTC